MIYSMFISEVSEMSTSIVQAVLTSLGDETQLCLYLKSTSTFLREKKGSVVKSFCWDICTIGVDMAESYIFNY
jgi:hypothetical protein